MIRKIRYELEFDLEEEARLALEGVNVMMSIVIKSTPRLEAMAAKIIPIDNGYKVIADGIPKENLGLKGMVRKEK